MRLEPSRIAWPLAISVLCLAPAAGAQSDRPLVEGMSQRLTVACGSEGAKVQGSGNTVTLTGTCSTVLVEGQNNTVHIATLGKLTVAGMNNKVYWTAGIGGAEPKITKEGIGNTVEHKTPADSPATTATTKPAATTTAASGAASAGPTVSASGQRGTATATTGGGTPSVTATGQRGTATATTGGGTPSVTATGQRGTATATAGSSPTVTASGQRGTATATTAGGTPSVDVASSSGKKVAMSTGGEGGPTVSAGTSAPSGARTRATATAPATTSMGTGTPIVVANNQQVRTMDCEGRAVSVSGNGNRLTLKGACGPIVVGGNENILDVGSTTRIDTGGNRNVVKYRELVNDKAPVVSGGGTGNRVSKVEPQ